MVEESTGLSYSELREELEESKKTSGETIARLTGEIDRLQSAVNYRDRIITTLLLVVNREFSK